MSYIPLAEGEKDDVKKGEALKHRNPIYPLLKYPRPQAVHTLQSEITSSLLFQQLIYFNWYYSILFFYLYAASQINRFIYFDSEFGIPVRVIVGLIFMFLEVCRLQNAFYGNIRESFPEVCAFLMMTILTLAAQLILIGGLVPASPMEWTLLFYGIIFHLLEFLVCIITMGKLTQSQKALFLWKNPLSNPNHAK